MERNVRNKIEIGIMIISILHIIRARSLPQICYTFTISMANLLAKNNFHNKFAIKCKFPGQIC